MIGGVDTAIKGGGLFEILYDILKYTKDVLLWATLYYLNGRDLIIPCIRFRFLYRYFKIVASLSSFNLNTLGC